MAKKAKRPIIIPADVHITTQDGRLRAKGPLGELELEVPSNIKVEVKDNSIFVLNQLDNKETFSLQGTYWTLINNMITGVLKGYEKTLILQGTGYRAQLGGGGLQLFIGYTKPVTFQIPKGIKVELQTVKSADKGDLTYIILKGIDKKLLGDFAALLRKAREPDPYKHKGIKYAEEILRKKVGKRAAVQAT